MIFPSWQSSLSLHRILVLTSRRAPQHWRQVSTTSAINRSLRGSRDSGYAQRGGRDRGSSGLNRSSGPPGRDRPQGFVRSDGTRRPRDENGGAPFKRNSSSPEYAPRGRRDEIATVDRSVRARGKDGYRGQPGFAARSSREEDDFPSYQRKDSSDERSERRRPLGFEPRSRIDASGDGNSSRGTGRRESAGRSRRDFDAGQEGFLPERRGRVFGDGDRSFGGRRDRDPGPERSDFPGHREGKFEERRKGFAGRRDREPVEGRREVARPHFRSTESSYRKDGVPSSGNERAVSAPAVESTEESAGARNGLLRDIKTACKLIRSIQKSEASGEDTSELINMTIASLRSVNKHVTSGKFQDEPSEAIASLFEKKAFAGTFIDIADAASSNASVLFQRGDGKIELAARRRDSATPHSRRTATKLDSRKEYEERSPEVTRDGRAGPRVKESRNSRNSESREEDGNDGIPVSIPYTTAASEFIYGKNAVFAALKAQRRKLYNLYVHPNIIEREASGNTGRSAKSRYAKPEHEFTTLAKNANVPFRNEYKAFLLDKMSDGRPHNGVVLEASKLPAPPILALGKPDIRKSAIPLVVGTQSVEELVVNGGAESISVSTNSWRHPFVVLLDGILDPVNVGSIMRTCHFYGADAVAVATNTCAPLASGVLAKASSGACEAVQILSLPKPSNFVHDSAKAGWKIYAAVAPEAGAPSRDAKRQLTTAAVAAASPLADHPCILMLGAEGEGLRENLKNRADAFVSIERGPNNAPDVGVDSMNVGVAAGVLMEAFLRKPAEAPEKIDTTSELGF